MQNSGHRGHYEQCRLQQGLPGGIIPHHRTRGDSYPDLPHLTSQHTSSTCYRKQAQGDLVL